MPPRRRVRRAPKRRVAKRKGHRRGRAPTSSKQMARITETIEYKNLDPNQVLSCSFNLNQFQRARTLATNFRWYKATHVTWTLEPQFTTYQSGAGFSSVPYLYQVMNRTQDADGRLTLSDMLTMGARPKKLTSVIKTSYRPNWCSPGLLTQNVVAGAGFGGLLNNIFMNGVKPEFGWLQAPNDLPAAPIGINPPQNLMLGQTTSSANTIVRNVPSACLYNGHQYYIEQNTFASSVNNYKVTCRVQWSFKDPKNVLAIATDNIFEDLSGALA